MRITHPRRVGIGLASLLAAWALSMYAHADARSDSLIVALAMPLTTVDRLYSVQREGLVLAQLTDDGLFHVDPDTLEFVPLAAASYEWVGETRLDVVLRDDVKFHDGSPLTADDVVYTFDWVLDRDSGTSRGPVIRGWLDRVEKIDEHRVSFHLKVPYPMALRDMAVSVPLRKQGSYAHTGTRAVEQQLNGIGPYRVTGFRAGREIELTRFEDYYQASPKANPAIKYMRFRVIPDQGTQQAELLSGGIDLMLDVPPDVADNVRHLPNVERLEGDDIRIGYITLDAAGYSDPNTPFKDVRVRRALNHAINRQAITQYLVRGSAQALDFACHPLQFGCEGTGPVYAYDPDKARALLTEAGYPNGFSFDLWAYRDKVMGEAIVNDLRAVGINANLRYVKLNVFSKVRNDRDMSAFFASYGGGGTADASAITGVHFVANTPRNYSGDEELAATVLAAERTIDPERRLELYRQALDRIADQAYWVPMFSYSQNFLLAPGLDLSVPRDGVPRLWQARWSN